MGRKIVLIPLIIIMALISIGCADSVDINDKNIATIFAVDTQGEDVFFYAEIPNLAKSAQGEQGGGGDNYEIIYGKGENYARARSNLDYKMDKELFLGTVRSLVLTKEHIETGGINYLYRSQSLIYYRKAIGVVTTQEKLEDLLDVESENNVSVGYAIEDTIKTLDNLGEGVIITTSQVLEYLYSKNACFTIPNIDIRDDRLSLTGYTVIHNDEFAGFIPIKESKGLVWFLNPSGRLVYKVPFGDDTEAAVRVELKSKKIKPSYNKNKASFDVSFSFDGQIMYRNGDIPLTDIVLDEINDNLQKMLRDDITKTVDKSRELECEYLGFDDAFRISYPTLYEEIDWSQTYLDSKINIKVKNKLDPGGLMDFNPD